MTGSTVETYLKHITIVNVTLADDWFHSGNLFKAYNNCEYLEVGFRHELFQVYNRNVLQHNKNFV